MFFFHKKETIALPTEFLEFPQFSGVVKSGPHIKETDKYIRLTYYVKKVDTFRETLENAGYHKTSDVRYDRGYGYPNYVIVEKDFLKYKIAYHKVK